MCVLACAWRAHPRWQVVLIGNRDELHSRATAPLARWDDQPHIIAGRDLEAGGTWLGISEERRLAVVTNVATPEGPQPDKASRGALVADILNGEGRYAHPVENQLDEFNPFNVITIDHDVAQLLTNRPVPEQRTLSPGIYGLSNSACDENWPKTERIKSILGSWLDQDDGNGDELLDALRTDDAPQVEPRQAKYSPLFIRNPRYGTRCSTVAAVDDRGSGWIVERRFDADSVVIGETRKEFSWAP